MNKTLSTAILLGSVLLMTGCSSTCRSWSLRDTWNNRPTPVRNYFMRGKPCSSCNPPAGQLNSYSENFVSGCENGNCGSGVAAGTQPVMSGSNVPYYPSDMPSAGTTNNTIRNNFPPAFSTDEFGSGLQAEAATLRTNVELETPPMYGSKKGF